MAKVVKITQTAEQRRERALKEAIVEARGLMAQGYQIRIHQIESSKFTVFGRKGVTR